MAGILVGMALERLPARNHLVLSVAIVLADAADPDGGNIYPSVARVARLARCSERAVQSVLQELQGLGFVELEERGGGRGKSSRYRIRRGWLEAQPSLLAEDEKNYGAGRAPLRETVHGAAETAQKPRKKGAPAHAKGCTKGARAGAPNPIPFDPKPDTPRARAREATCGGGGEGEVGELVEAAVWAARAAGRPLRSPAAFRRAVQRRIEVEGASAEDLDDLARWRAARDAEARRQARLAESAAQVQAEASHAGR